MKKYFTAKNFLILAFLLIVAYVLHGEAIKTAVSNITD